MASCSSSAQSTARCSGALPEADSLKCAMIESPMNLSIMPSWANTTSIIVTRQRFSTWSTVSGG